MPEYAPSGVYVTEVALNNRPIEGVSASTASLVGSEVMEELQRLVNQVPVGSESGKDNSTIALLELLSWLSDTLARSIDELGNEAYLPAARLIVAALALVSKNRTPPDSSVLKRVRFFEAQLLEDDDLNVELDYMRSKRRRKIVSGIVSGLQVTVQDGGSGAAVDVSPGCALDKWGRKIVLGTPITLPLPDAVKRVSVIARPTGRFAVLPSLECEFLIVDEANDDDLTVGYLEKSPQGWRVLNGKNC